MQDGYDVLIIKGGIFAGTLTQVKECVEDRQADTLYLVLDTPGGDPGAGFRISRLLDAKYKKIYILVPDRAMSTGTLMALGGDKIYMFHSSCLGPLDLQIEHPNDGSRISTLDVRDTWYTIYSLAESVSQRIFRQAYGDFDLNKTAAAKLASENAANFIKPIVDKIDPYHLHASYRSAEVGAKYAAKLLKARMMKGKPGVADIVSSHLANDYETHNYAITLDEAKDQLKLSVDDLGSLAEWSDIRSDYNRLGDGVQLVHKLSQPPTPAPAADQKQKTTNQQKGKEGK